MDYCSREGLVGPAYDACIQCVQEGRKKYGESGGYKSICKQQALAKHPPFGIKPSEGTALLAEEGGLWTKSEKMKLFSSLQHLADSEKLRSEVQTRSQDTIAQAAWT